MSKRNIILFAVFGIIAVVAIGAGFYYSYKSNAPEAVTEAKLNDFTIEKPNFVARGAGLSKVEIWAVPTGTNINVENFTLLGEAQRESENSTEQRWILAIPKDPILVTEIFAKGFDMKGEAMVTQALSVTGATELFELLWGPRVESVDLKIGESATYDTMTLTFTGIKEDSRCAIDVVCMQAGRVVAEVKVTMGTTQKNGTIATDANPFVFEKYYIEIEKVLPEPKSTVKIKTADYSVSFLISTDVKG